MDSDHSVTIHAETSFSDALHASPALRKACNALVADNNLRTLRLVSRSVAKAAMGEVECFSVHLGDHPWTSHSSPDGSDLAGAVRLLKYSSLKVLHVDLGGEIKDQGIYPCTPKGWSQLDSFVSGMTSALRSVTTLFINTHLHSSRTNDVYTMRMVAVASASLAALAKACPALVTLHLDGEIGLQALTALGSSCTELLHLHLTASSIPCIILHHLHNIFPVFISFEVKAFDDQRDGEGQRAAVEAYCIDAAHALSSCAKLMLLSLPSLNIDNAVTWAYFPSSLLILAIGNCLCPPPLGIMLPHLIALQINCSMCYKGSMHVSIGAGILQAAPNLTNLQAINFTLVKEADLQSLQVYHKRLQLGMSKLPFMIGQGNEITSGDFLQGFSVFPAFAELHLMSLTIFGNSILHLARVFPNLRKLFFVRCDVSDDSVSLLLGLTSLHSLEIAFSPGLTDAGALTCLRLPSLIFFRVNHCSVYEVAALQSQARPGLEVVVDNPAPKPAD